MNLPGSDDDFELNLLYPLDEWYEKWMCQEKVEIREKITDVKVIKKEVWASFLEWAQYVVWYGHRTGGYMLDDQRMCNDISGHY